MPTVHGCEAQTGCSRQRQAESAFTFLPLMYVSCKPLQACHQVTQPCSLQLLDLLFTITLYLVSCVHVPLFRNVEQQQPDLLHALQEAAALLLV